MTLDDIIKASEGKLTFTKEDFEKWSRLPHNAEGLDLFLANNLADVVFETKKSETRRCFLTSNMDLVKEFCNIASFVETKPTKTNKKKSKAKEFVLSWDIIRRKSVSIHGEKWKIMNFIPIDTKNVKLLTNIMNDLAKRKPKE